MKVSELAAGLREMRIFNTHGVMVAFDEGRYVAVSFEGRGGPRSMMPAQSRVWSPLFKTAPDAPYYDRGTKAFIGSRSETLQKAMEWAKATYGDVEFVPCPLIRGNYIPKPVLERAKAAVIARRTT